MDIISRILWRMLPSYITDLKSFYFIYYGDYTCLAKCQMFCTKGGCQSFFRSGYILYGFLCDDDVITKCTAQNRVYPYLR